MKKNKQINYIHFQSIDSTNTWAKNNAVILDPDHITCITAHEQTSGRGSFQKKWISPKGVNLYATYYFCIPPSSSYIPNLGQIFSISCCKMLKNFKFSPQIKWPNDILLEEKKVAGILCETIQLQKSLGVILGIGLNINMTNQTLCEIDQKATSLHLISNQQWDIEKILDNLTSCFLEDLKTLESQGFQPFASFYEESLAFKGEKVTIQDGSRLLSGSCHGISPNGNLILLSDSEEKTEVFAGSMIY